MQKHIKPYKKHSPKLQNNSKQQKSLENNGKQQNKYTKTGWQAPSREKKGKQRKVDKIIRKQLKNNGKPEKSKKENTNIQMAPYTIRSNTKRQKQMINKLYDTTIKIIIHNKGKQYKTKEN